MLAELLLVIIQCRIEMESWHSIDKRSNANQLLGSLTSPSFLVALFALEAVSAVLLPASRCFKASGYRRSDRCTGSERLHRDCRAGGMTRTST